MNEFEIRITFRCHRARCFDAQHLNIDGAEWRAFEERKYEWKPQCMRNDATRGRTRCLLNMTALHLSPQSFWMFCMSILSQIIIFLVSWIYVIVKTAFVFASFFLSFFQKPIPKLLSIHFGFFLYLWLNIFEMRIGWKKLYIFLDLSLTKKHTEREEDNNRIEMQFIWSKWYEFYEFKWIWWIWISCWA